MSKQHIITDWATVTPAIFDGVDIQDREATEVVRKAFFDAHKATRSDMEPHLKTAYNSNLHRLLNHIIGDLRKEAGASQRKAEVKAEKGKLKQHIKAEAKAKADKAVEDSEAAAAALVKSILDQAEAAGIDISPLAKLLEA